MSTPTNSSAQIALRITTIHNVKGETLEALMLVSSRIKAEEQAMVIGHSGLMILLLKRQGSPMLPVHVLGS